MPGLDALCAPVDAFAVGAMGHLHALGKRIPQDVQVVTRYDGIRARTAQPPLTAVNLHLERVAALAVELLFAHLSGDRSQHAVAGPAPELVVRASSAIDQTD